MAVANESRPQRFGTAGVAGLVGGIAMGVLLHAGTDLLPMIGSIVGVESAIGGWIVHLVLSVSFAFGFVGVLSATPLSLHVTDAADVALLGAAYGGLIGLLTVGVVLPVAATAGGGAVSAGAVGPFGDPLEPIVDAAFSFAVGAVLGVAHMVYGVTMGAVVGIRHRSVPDVRGVQVGG